MAIAHVCVQCGLDLARMRARLEPHYNLPLVVCPRCTRATVRREHPIWTGYKRLRRIDCALAILIFQVAFIAIFATLTMFAVFALVMVMLEVPKHRAEAVPWIVLYSLAVLPVVKGAWLTVAFSHVKRWKVWCGWFAFMLLPLSGLGLWLIFNEEFQIGGLYGSGFWMIAWLDIALSVGLFCVVAAVPLCAIMLIGFAGIPLGKLIQLVFAMMQRSRWRWRRRMLRRRRSE